MLKRQMKVRIWRVEWEGETEGWLPEGKRPYEERLAESMEGGDIENVDEDELWSGRVTDWLVCAV